MWRLMFLRDPKTALSATPRFEAALPLLLIGRLKTATRLVDIEKTL